MHTFTKQNVPRNYLRYIPIYDTVTIFDTEKNGEFLRLMSPHIRGMDVCSILERVQLFF